MHACVLSKGEENDLFSVNQRKLYSFNGFNIIFCEFNSKINFGLTEYLTIKYRFRNKYDNC